MKNLNFNSSIEISENYSVLEHFFGALTDDDLFVYSPTSLNLIDIKVDLKNMLSSKTIGTDKEAIDHIIAGRSFRRVVSLGNGRATDIAKYIAARLSIELVAIPTAFTTNVLFTSKSCLIERGEKRAFDAKMPNRVIVDRTLINKTDFKYQLFGLCDVLSIYTALNDWNISHRNTGEPIDKFIFEQANFTFSQLLEQKGKILMGDANSLDLILKLVMMSGYITNLAGSGRPESGSEHIMASFLENNTRAYHAICVTAGILLAMELQGSAEQGVLGLISDLGLLKALAEDKAIVNKLPKLAGGVKPRKDRYTVLNEKSILPGHLRNAYGVIKSSEEVNLLQPSRAYSGAAQTV